MSHLKKIASPKTWPVTRKHEIWITRNNPGPHTLKTSISLNTVFKDLLKYTKTTRETKRIINQGNVFINQKPRKNIRFPLGIFDVLSLPTGEDFRLLYNKLGRFNLIPIKKEEANILLYKIRSKTRLKNKKIQLNLQDGSNILIDKDGYSTGDTLIIEKGKIKEHLKLEDSSTVFVIGGKHIGSVGELKKTEAGLFTIKTKKETFPLLKKHIFVIGKNKPLIATEK